jgi:hypothetical protein
MRVKTLELKKKKNLSSDDSVNEKVKTTAGRGWGGGSEAMIPRRARCCGNILAVLVTEQYLQILNPVQKLGKTMKSLCHSPTMEKKFILSLPVSQRVTVQCHVEKGIQTEPELFWRPENKEKSELQEPGKPPSPRVLLRRK